MLYQKYAVYFDYNKMKFALLGYSATFEHVKDALAYADRLRSERLS